MCQSIDTAYVGIAHAGSTNYPSQSDGFRPSESYPEYSFAEIAEQQNDVYAAVRESLHLMGLDAEHYGTPYWNPFIDIIHAGDTVLVKPNLVRDSNTNLSGGVECLYTQPSVVAPVLDYVFKALNGTGRVVLGDAPMQECDFDALIKQSGYQALVQYYIDKGLPLQLVDFRKDITTVKFRIGTRETDEKVPGTIVNLAEESEFYGAEDADPDKLRIISYPHDNLTKHHHGAVQEYCVSSYVLNADVIINMPKPKTHKKAGITGAMKNMVGACAKKDFLPHHTYGSSEEGGDEYLKKNRLQRYRSDLYDRKYQYEDQRKFFRAWLVWTRIAVCTSIFRVFKVKYENGSWYGNHTISKTINDLNKIVFYANKDGVMQESQQRRYFIVADMIISGQKNGPVAPSPKDVGIIAAGDNPVCFDEALAALMGFDKNKIPTLVQARNAKPKYSVSNGKVHTVLLSNQEKWNKKDITTIERKESFQYVVSDGWKGHIELEK